MGQLHQSFENTAAKIGLTHTMFPTAVFHSAPIGIRFEIGGSEDVYLPNHRGMNPIYVDHAFHRAKTLFDNLPCPPDLLRIDSYPGEKDEITPQILSQIGLPAPDESIQGRRVDEDGCCLQEHLYWDLTKGRCQTDKLLLELIKSDIGGLSCLCSNVYLLSTQCSVLYHLYDDRGADIVASDKRLLLPLYRNCNSWILPFNKDRIDQLFAGEA